MKELELKKEDKIEIVKQTKQEKKTVLVNRIKPYEGHKCFEYNTVTGSLSFATFMETSIDFVSAQKGEIAHKSKVMIKENCIYITALNKKNACKKLGISNDVELS